MSSLDLIIISQSEIVRYENYSVMPLERIDLYQNLVQLRMIYHDGGFRSHLDLFNKAIFGKYFHEAAYDTRRKMLSIWNLPSLNSFLATSALVRAGYNIKIINNFDAEYDIFKQNVQSMPQPLIALSTTFILQWSEIGRIVKKIRGDFPDTPIILGGAFVHNQFLTRGAASFEKPMRKYGIKYVLFACNSEYDLLSLIKHIKNGQQISDLPNICSFDEKNAFQVSSSLWHEPDLTPLPWERFDTSHIRETVQIRTTSGCPYKCAFCNYPATAQGFFQSPADALRTQMNAVLKLGSIKAIVFIDDTLNANPKRFREMLEVLKEFPFKWYAFLRVHLIDESQAKAMKESGCDGVYLGLESGSDIVLANMNKKARTSQYRDGISYLQKYGIPVFAMFIVGFPGETERTVQETINFIESNPIDYYSIKEFFYLRNAPIHHKRDDYGLSGEGYIWQHDTMTSSQASQIKLNMFNTIKNSVYIDPDMGLWYLIYLRGKGFSWETILQCQLLINEMTRQDNAGSYTEKDSVFSKFCALVKEDHA